MAKKIIRAVYLLFLVTGVFTLGLFSKDSKSGALADKFDLTLSVPEVSADVVACEACSDCGCDCCSAGGGE